LKLDESTLIELKRKHPSATKADKSILVDTPSTQINPIIYEKITGDVIKQVALKTKGAAGPSGLDAEAWRRILISKNFGNHGEELCKTIALMARKLCTEKTTILDGQTSVNTIE